MKRFALIILVLSLSLFCLLMSMEYHSFNISNYTQNYQLNGVQGVTGKSMQELNDITVKLVDYLKGKAGEEALRPHFNDKEVLHMEDVQVLFRYGFVLKYITMGLSLILIITFALKGERDLLGKYIYKGLFANWIIAGLLLIMIVFDFNKYFTYFHLIFFNNDLWILDPNTDLLIQMLPEEFFIDIARQIGLSFLMYVATIQGIGYAITRKGREKGEKTGKIFKRKS